MALIKKLALGSIFISVLCIFAMSHNVSAIQFTLDLNSYETKYYAGGISTIYKYDQNGSNLSNNISCVNCTPSGNALINIRYLQPAVGPIYYEKDDIITFDLLIWTNQNYGIDNVVKTINFFPTDQTIFQYIGYDELSNEYAQNIYSTYSNNDNNQIESFDIWSKNQGFKVLRIFFKVKNNITADFSLTSSNFIFQYFSILNEITFRTANFTVYRFIGSEENREVEQKTQEAVDESQAAGSGSSSSASQGGANLLSAITGFFNVITSAQPSTCRFNAPLNTYFGNERLNVDLCALDLPSGIGALTSIIAIGILIPFAIHMFNKFIALFRSFQS